MHLSIQKTLLYSTELELGSDTGVMYQHDWIWGPWASFGGDNRHRDQAGLQVTLLIIDMV